jgi:hypothetical protein
LPIYATAVAHYFYAPWNYLLLGAIPLCRRKNVNKLTPLLRAAGLKSSGSFSFTTNRDYKTKSKTVRT